MNRRGALIIAPHVNVESGILGAKAGMSRSAMWKHDGLSAAAVSPGVALSADAQLVIENAHPDCTRPHALAIIHADDVNHPDRLSVEWSSTWIKASSPSFAGLQVALRAPATRVSRTDPERAPHSVISRISWRGGFLDGLEIPFSESLTAIIGGRGTGKSTVIESLRYVLDQPPIGERARIDHRGVVDKVLKSATVISV